MANNDTLWLQAAGADPAITYSALDARMLVEASLTEGVVGLDDLKVTQRAAGANLSVDVAAGLVVIAGDDAANQGQYLSRSAALNTGAGSIATGPGGANARIDLVVARMYDKLVTGSAYGLAIEVIAGTAGATPVAPAVPNGAIALAEVRMNAADTSALDARITDRRWRGLPLGSLLASSTRTTNGTSAVGSHDSGLSCTFVMPALAPGRRVEVEVSAYYINFVSAVLNTTLYSVLRDSANVIRATVFGWGPPVTAVPASWPGNPRALLTNTDYSAGTIVTMKLATNSASSVAHQVFAGVDAPMNITAKLV